MYRTLRTQGGLRVRYKYGSCGVIQRAFPQENNTGATCSSKKTIVIKKYYIYIIKSGDHMPSLVCQMYLLNGHNVIIFSKL